MNFSIQSSIFLLILLEINNPNMFWVIEFFYVQILRKKSVMYIVLLYYYCIMWQTSTLKNPFGLVVNYCKYWGFTDNYKCIPVKLSLWNVKIFVIVLFLTSFVFYLENMIALWFPFQQKVLTLVWVWSVWHLLFKIRCLITTQIFSFLILMLFIR